ncbi:MAG: membrane protease subunit stomatin/prohibitin-like protein [Candidatus Magnetoglobus multicellularis str. Araruama]|uniref:Membrane protease subunit stomatin/prohibitin-like protein n=1 Tax=Candidatus Magnetoglobus multicellularis str. Araruama TaxID=890399 RepID=A0A1V1P867_9BACT|nr:MAG: membrane protease subunit stomatin/prohibitin-like protein [Candidatus Magnetoglobus multicellularis str. Araruama]
MKLIPKIYIPAIASFFLVLIMIIAFLASRIFYSIKPGEAGVRWSRFSGTEINHIYQEGLNVIFPWDEMYIYNIRIQELPVNLNVLTKSGLTVNLLLSIRFAPDFKLLGVLHRHIGPDYAKTVIIPEIESVLREIIGTMDAEDIYTSGRKVIIEAINNAIEQVAQRYINVDDVLIRKIELPETISEAIQFKIKQKQLVQAHKHIVAKEKQEALRKEIEAIGIHRHNQIILQSIKDQNILKWRGIEALHAFAKSDNAKIFVVGYGKDGVPIILNTETK